MRTSLLGSLVIVALTGFNLNPIHADDWNKASDPRFGAGLIVGEPTGISLKYWLAERSAIDGVVGRSFEGRNNLYLQAGYLHHLFDLVDVGRDQFAVYFGGGVRYQLFRNRSDRFGIRGVGGVAYLFDSIPVDVFFELGPIFDLTPSRTVRFGAGVGARYWF